MSAEMNFVLGVLDAIGGVAVEVGGFFNFIGGFLF